MFFRKKKETDVDVLQKIKDKITEDEQKKGNNAKKNIAATGVDAETEINNVSEGDDTDKEDVAEIGRSVLENVSQIVDKAIHDNNDKQNQFENSLESDFLSDVFAVADTKAEAMMNAHSNEENGEMGIESNTSTTGANKDVEDYEDDNETDDFNFDDELDDGEDLQTDEDGLLNDDEDTTAEIETLVISGDRTDDKEKNTDKQEQEVWVADGEKTDALKQSQNEEKGNPDMQHLEIKKEEMQSFAKNDEDDLLSNDEDLENDVKAEPENEDVSGIGSNVGNVVEKKTELSNAQASTLNKNAVQAKEENIAFPNVPKMVKKDISEKSNVAYADVQERPNDDAILGVSDGGDGMMHIVRQNDKDQKMNHGISQQTQKGVKTSITDLIENVKNQIMQNNRSVASRGGRADGGKTMEQFVADLVHPHIVRYLDGNLERIVNNIVQKEIKKIIDEVEGE